MIFYLVNVKSTYLANLILSANLRKSMFLRQEIPIAWLNNATLW